MIRLSNLYNNLERASPSRCDVYLAIISVAAKGDDVEVLIPTLAHVDGWLTEWHVGSDTKKAVYLKLADVLGTQKE